MLRRAVFLSNNNLFAPNARLLLPVVAKGYQGMNENRVVMDRTKKEKKKPGRPVQNARKDIRAAVRFARADYTIIEQKAGKAGLKISEFIRQSSMNVSIKSRLTPEEMQLVRKLVGMSTNMNQVARTCHREGLFEAMVYFENYRNAMDSLLQKLKS
jgi:predicted DNA binding CopG/RHH family protein